MTCEIVVMNREAIALAADSAETVFGRKVFPSAEKLFSLAHNQPVGIMIYGDADISSVPWETIIKRYRDKLADRTYDTLDEYGKKFIEFLENNEDGLIPEEAQESYMSSLVTECFDAIVDDINTMMSVIFKRKATLTEDVLRAIIKLTVNGYCDALNSVDMYPSIPGDYADKIRDKYQSNKDKYIEAFENLPIQDMENKIEEIAVNIFTRNIRDVKSSGIDFFDKYVPTYSSGIVIAGFGEKDTFPSTTAYDIEGMLINHLKYVHLEGKSSKIGVNKSTADVIPFATTDMTMQFLFGIDTSLEQYLNNESKRLYNQECYRIIKHDRKLSGDEKKGLVENFHIN